LGKATAFKLAERGCQLTLVARGEQELKKTVEEIKKKFGVIAKGYVCDTSKPEQVKKVLVLDKDGLKELKKYYEDVSKDLLSKELKKLDNRIKDIAEKFDRLPHAVDNLKEEDEKTYEAIRKAVDSYRSVVLSILPKVYIMAAENARIISAPKFGKWIEMSCAKVNEDEKDKEKDKK